MTHFEVKAIALNDRGLVRKNNEDNFYLNGVFLSPEMVDHGVFFSMESTDDVQLYAVCDGMGGTDCGEDASALAIQELKKWQETGIKITELEEITTFLQAISDKVYEQSNKRNRSAGTTIAMLLILHDKIYAINVGDSRIYEFKNHILKQLSLDHTTVQKMVTMGLMTPEEAKKDSMRHVLSQHLGMSEEGNVSPHYEQVIYPEKDEIFLLCSDGLTDLVEDKIIHNILLSTNKLEDVGQNMLSEAFREGGKDNITVMLVKIREIKSVNPNDFQKRWRIISVLLTLLQVTFAILLVLTLIDLLYFFS